MRLHLLLSSHQRGDEPEPDLGPSGSVGEDAGNESELASESEPVDNPVLQADAEAEPEAKSKPDPRASGVITLTILFLLGCVFYGYADFHPTYGGVRYAQNIITVPAVPGAVRYTQPFNINGEPKLELLFAPNHPRAQDMPDRFTFDWTMVEWKTRAIIMTGRVQFSGARVRRDPSRPPIAVVPLPQGLEGEYMVTVAPLELGDWPDLEFYLVQVNNKRLIGFTLAGIFWAVFLALLAVVVRRYRAATRA